MKSGELNHRIKFYKHQQIPDGFGGSTPYAVNIRETNAKVVPLRQDRTVQANQQDLIGGYEIYIRYRTDFIPDKTMFIEYRGVSLTISSVQQWHEDRQMYLIIAMVKDERKLVQNAGPA